MGLGFASFADLFFFLVNCSIFELQRGKSDDTTVSRESHIYCQESSHLHIITSPRKNGKPFYMPMDADPEQNDVFFLLLGGSLFCCAAFCFRVLVCSCFGLCFLGISVTFVISRREVAIS